MSGGMEHQTMTTLSSFEITLASHELAHQWFGDLVTCKNWQDIWLNEGFASYGEYLTLDKLESHQSAKSWMDYAHTCAEQDSVGTVYIPDDDKYNELRIFNFNLTYKKGASIIHQLRYEINNDELFFSILRQYLVKYSYSVADVTDFANMVSLVTKQDYSWFFKQWYYGKGYPKFDITWQQDKDTLYIYSHQTTSSYENSFFKMHIDIQIKYNKTDSIIRLSQDKNEEVFKIPVNKEVEKIVVDPERSGLLKIINVSSARS